MNSRNCNGWEGLWQGFGTCHQKLLPARQARWTRPWPWAGAGKVPSRKHTLPSSAPSPRTSKLRASSFKLQTPNPCFLCCNHRNLTAPAPGCFEFRAAGFGAKVDRIAIPSPTKWAIRDTTDYSDAIIIVIAIATSGGRGTTRGEPDHMGRAVYRVVVRAGLRVPSTVAITRAVYRGVCNERAAATEARTQDNNTSACEGVATAMVPRGCSLPPRISLLDVPLPIC